MLELGRVSKAHGLKGDVIVALTTDRTAERMAVGSVLYLRSANRSRRDPERQEQFVVRSAQPYQDKWLVGLDGVDTRERADELRASVIFGEPLTGDQVLENDVVFVHEVIGKHVIDQHGTDHGPVLSVIDNPASDLLELADDRLVPLAFFVSQDDRVIEVDVPLGLLPSPPGFPEADTPGS